MRVRTLHPTEGGLGSHQVAHVLVTGCAIRNAISNSLKFAQITLRCRLQVDPIVVDLSLLRIFGYCLPIAIAIILYSGCARKFVLKCGNQVGLLGRLILRHHSTELVSSETVDGTLEIYSIDFKFGSELALNVSYSARPSRCRKF